MKNQVESVSIDELVPQNHSYRLFKKFLDEERIKEALKDLSHIYQYDGYGIERLFNCLLLQYIEDLSDRELERYLKENIAAKWFCGFGLSESTPSYSLFSKVRDRIGTERLSKLFAAIRDSLRQEGLMSEVFSFVDATHLISKANLWRERDEAIAEGYEKLNNEVLPKVAKDTDVRIGCKGKDKFWFGYKQQVCVDMQSGLINKVAVRRANESDAQGLRHVCPKQGAVYTDKGYCLKPAKNWALRQGVHLVAIKRNNMQGKNLDLDKWVSKIRAPFERIFSKWPKRTRFRSLAKNQFCAFMTAITLNLKRLIVLHAA